MKNGDSSIISKVLNTNNSTIQNSFCSVSNDSVLGVMNLLASTMSTQNKGKKIISEPNHLNKPKVLQQNFRTSKMQVINPKQISQKKQAPIAILVNLRDDDITEHSPIKITQNQPKNETIKKADFINKEW